MDGYKRTLLHLAVALAFANGGFYALLVAAQPYPSVAYRVLLFLYGSASVLMVWQVQRWWSELYATANRIDANTHVVETIESEFLEILDPSMPTNAKNDDPGAKRDANEPPPYLRASSLKS